MFDKRGTLTSMSRDLPLAVRLRGLASLIFRLKYKLRYSLVEDDLKFPQMFRGNPDLLSEVRGFLSEKRNLRQIAYKAFKRYPEFFFIQLMDLEAAKGFYLIYQENRSVKLKPRR